MPASEEERLLSLAKDQMAEDRKLIKESYEKFSSQINTANDYFQNGQNLNKCLELMIKQTSQVVELLKLENSTGKNKNKTLTAEEVEDIYKGMGSSDGNQFQ